MAEHTVVTEYWPDGYVGFTASPWMTDSDTWLRKQVEEHEHCGWELCGVIYRPRVPHPDAAIDKSLVCEKMTLIFKK